MGKKFNIGDKVRVSDKYEIVAARGKIGVVVEPKRSLSPYDYEVDFGKMDFYTHGGTRGDVKKWNYRYFYESELELVEKKIKSTDSTTPKTKYKPGDEVTVKSSLSQVVPYWMADGNNGTWVTNQMLTKRGKKVKIKSVTKTGKYLIEGSIFCWVDEMFEDPDTEPKLVCFVNFKKGGQLYCYLTEDTSITVGSEVIVPVGKVNKPCKVKVKVMRIGYYNADELDISTKDMKKVIEKVEPPIAEEDIPLRVACEKGILNVSIDISKIK